MWTTASTTEQLHQKYREEMIGQGALVCDLFEDYGHPAKLETEDRAVRTRIRRARMERFKNQYENLIIW